MEIIIKKDKEEIAEEIINRIKELIKKKRHPVIGLPTGNTPKIIYKKMIEEYEKKNIDFSDIVIFALDEYLGIHLDHPASTREYFRKNLLNHINVKEENLYFINGTPDNIEEECRKVEENIRDRGGIDFVILGLGQDGHISFNEPGSSLTSRTRVKPLTQSTIKHLSQFFGNEEKTPRFCITFGLGTIMDAKEIALIAYGYHKAVAIKKCVEGPISASFPGSIVQMHPKAKIFLDDESANLLDEKEYYKWAYENKHKMFDYLNK